MPLGGRPGIHAGNPVKLGQLSGNTVHTHQPPASLRKPTRPHQVPRPRPPACGRRQGQTRYPQPQPSSPTQNRCSYYRQRFGLSFPPLLGRPPPFGNSAGVHGTRHTHSPGSAAARRSASALYLNPYANHRLSIASRLRGISGSPDVSVGQFAAPFLGSAGYSPPNLSRPRAIKGSGEWKPKAIRCRSRSFVFTVRGVGRRTAGMLQLRRRISVNRSREDIGASNILKFRKKLVFS